MRSIEATHCDLVNRFNETSQLMDDISHEEGGDESEGVGGSSGGTGNGSGSGVYSGVFVGNLLKLHQATGMCYCYMLMFMIHCTVKLINV